MHQPKILPTNHSCIGLMAASCGTKFEDSGEWKNPARYLGSLRGGGIVLMIFALLSTEYLSPITSKDYFTPI